MIDRIAVGLIVAVALPGLHHMVEEPVRRLGPLAEAHLAASGVSNPVTAVLLNFRGLDTLLEVTVLAAAALGALALPMSSPPPREIRHHSLLSLWLVPRLWPLIGVLVVYLWWAGTSHPGGAFQAGATLAGALLLLHFVDRAGRLDPEGPLVQRLVLFGPVVFFAVAAGTLVAGHGYLDYPEHWAKPLIVGIEAALTVSIGATLAVLAMGGRSPQ